MATITLKKPYLVEGKVLARGTRIIIRESDVEETPVKTSKPELDMAKVKRARRIAQMKRAEAEKDGGDEEKIEESEDDVFAMRRARKVRRTQKPTRRISRTEFEEEDEEDSEVVAERRARARRMAQMRRARR